MSRPWVLVPCLVALRRDFDRLNPGRDRASDGSIGDAAHAGRSSDHNPDEAGRTPFEDADDVNEVHALDVDAGVDPDDPDLMERAVAHIVARHRRGADTRLQNIIYRGRLWSVTSRWRAQPYGVAPHDEHAHFSARYTAVQEADDRPFFTPDDLEEPVTREQFMAWMGEWARSTAGKEALYEAVQRRDVIQEYNTDPDTLAQVVRPPTDADNGFMTPATALTLAVKNADFLRAAALKIDDKVDAVLAKLDTDEPPPPPPAKKATPAKKAAPAK